MTEIKNPSVIDFSDITDDQMNQMIDGTLTEFDEGSPPLFMWVFRP